LPPSESLETTMEKILKLREQMLSEGKRELGNEERVFTKTCSNCYKYQLMHPPGDDLIHSIKLASFPVLCQSNCVYCDTTRHNILDVSVFDKESIVSGYERVFNIVEYAISNGMVASDVVWKVITGEITVHPYKERIYNLIRDSQACFFTNCFVYDERIAKNLVGNQNSCILFSIDAGTHETWNRVKRTNNFSFVISNLIKYRSAGCRPEQVRLKYIFLPGINDNIEDYVGIVEIIRTLGLSNLEVARETNTKYTGQEFVDGVESLNAYLVKNGMTMQLFPKHSFSSDERKMILSQSENLA